MKNLKPFLTKLREFIDAVPADQSSQVNWDELTARKEVAQMSLDALSGILGGKDDEKKPKVCKPDKPGADDSLGDGRGFCPGQNPR